MKILLFDQVLECNFRYSSYELETSFIKPPWNPYFGNVEDNLSKRKRKRKEDDRIGDKALILNRSENKLSSNFIGKVVNYLRSENLAEIFKILAIRYNFVQEAGKVNTDSISVAQEQLLIVTENFLLLSKLDDSSLLESPLLTFNPLSITEKPWIIINRLQMIEKEFIWKASGIPCSILFPSNSKFYWGDIHQGLQTLSQYHQQSSLTNKYKVLLMDPPWPNRSVRRGGGGKYKHMHPNRLLSLQRYLQPILDPEHCLLAVWVTNDPRIMSFVKTTLLPTWGFTYYTCWVWVKVTLHGQPVFPPSSAHKKPVELLLIGVRTSLFPSTETKVTDTTSESTPSNSDSSEIRRKSDREGGVGLCLGRGDHEVTTDCLLEGLLAHLLDQETCGDGVRTSIYPHSQPYSTSTSMSTAKFCPENEVEDTMGTDWRHVTLVCPPLRHSWKPSVTQLLLNLLNSLSQPLKRIVESPSGETIACSGGDEAAAGSKGDSTVDGLGRHNVMSHEREREGCVTPCLWNMRDHNVVLELFARELVPGCTSVGDEVLLYQTVREEGGRVDRAFFKKRICP